MYICNKYSEFGCKPSRRRASFLTEALEPELLCDREHVTVLKGRHSPVQLAVRRCLGKIRGVLAHKAESYLSDRQGSGKLTENIFGIVPPAGKDEMPQNKPFAQTAQE